MAMQHVGVVPHHWWAVGLRGVAAIVFGVLAFAWPGLTLGVLVLMFGIYALIDGVMAIVSAIRSRGHQVWALLFRGVVGIVTGVLVFSWPGMTALLLVYFIGAWAVVTGVLESISAIRLRNVIPNEWAWIISGALSVVFGVIVLANPGAGALAVIWIIGTYAVLFGISLCALAWRVRELETSDRGHPRGEPMHQPAAL